MQSSFSVRSLTVRGDVEMYSGVSLAVDRLQGGGALTLPEGARVGAFEADVATLEIGSGATFEGMGSRLAVRHLRILSAGRLSAFSSPFTVSEKLDVAPHALIGCPQSAAGGDFYAAGSGTLGQPPTSAENASAICPWPSDWNSYKGHKWEAHQPAHSCNAEVKVCGADHASDYEASWLEDPQHGYLNRFGLCLHGTDGKPLFSLYDRSNLSKPCPPPSARREPRRAAA